MDILSQERGSSPLRSQEELSTDDESALISTDERLATQVPYPRTHRSREGKQVTSLVTKTAGRDALLDDHLLMGKGRRSSSGNLPHHRHTNLPVERSSEGSNLPSAVDPGEIRGHSEKQCQPRSSNDDPPTRSSRGAFVDKPGTDGHGMMEGQGLAEVEPPRAGLNVHPYTRNDIDKDSGSNALFGPSAMPDRVPVPSKTQLEFLNEGAGDSSQKIPLSILEEIATYDREPQDVGCLILTNDATGSSISAQRSEQAANPHPAPTVVSSCLRHGDDGASDGDTAVSWSDSSRGNSVEPQGDNTTPKFSPLPNSEATSMHNQDFHAALKPTMLTAAANRARYETVPSVQSDEDSDMEQEVPLALVSSEKEPPRNITTSKETRAPRRIQALQEAVQIERSPAGYRHTKEVTSVKGRDQEVIPSSSRLEPLDPQLSSDPIIPATCAITEADVASSVQSGQMVTRTSPRHMHELSQRVSGHRILVPATFRPTDVAFIDDIGGIARSQRKPTNLEKYQVTRGCSSLSPVTRQKSSSPHSETTKRSRSPAPASDEHKRQSEGGLTKKRRIAPPEFTQFATDLRVAHFAKTRKHDFVVGIVPERHPEPETDPDLARTDNNNSTEKGSIYETYMREYPDYGQSLNKFVTACAYVEWLQADPKQAPPHQSLWDDLIRVYTGPYNKYLKQMRAGGQLPKSLLAYYNSEVDEPVFTKKVITRKTLDEVFAVNPTIGKNERARFRRLSRHWTRTRTSTPIVSAEAADNRRVSVSSSRRESGASESRRTQASVASGPRFAESLTSREPATEGGTHPQDADGRELPVHTAKSGMGYSHADKGAANGLMADVEDTLKSKRRRFASLPSADINAVGGPTVDHSSGLTLSQVDNSPVHIRDPRAPLFKELLSSVVSKKRNRI